jgi:serine/threonine-protein kinase RsbW
MSTVETISVPGTRPGVRQAIDAFEGFGRTHDLPAEAAWRFLVALDEILSNIVRHAATGSGTAIDLRFSIDAGTVAIEIVDAAAPFNPLLAPAADTTSPIEQRRPGGLGIALVRDLMDDTRYERLGDRNHFVMTRRS